MVENLFIAIKSGQKSEVDLHLASGISANSKDSAGKSALYWAIEKKQKSIVDALISSGADVNAVAYEGLTHLYSAAVAGDTAILESLVSAGANVRGESKHRDLPLQMAHRYANARDIYELMELLMAKGGGSAQKLTALHAAAAFNRIDATKFLLARGAEVNARDSDGNTPLFWTTLAYGQKSAETLIEAGGNVNARNKAGVTPLHAASALGHSGMVSWLISNGAAIDAKDKDGWTALYWAGLGNRRSAMTELQKRNAVMSPGTPTAKEFGLREEDLLKRLEERRLPLTAYLLGLRASDAALGPLLAIGEPTLIGAYVSSTGSSYREKSFPMTKKIFELLHPWLKKPGLDDGAKFSLTRWIALSGLPEIEQPLLEALPFVPLHARREIESQLAERRFAPVLPYLLEGTGSIFDCNNLALLGTPPALKAAIECIAKDATGKKSRGDFLYQLSKHRGTVTIDFAALRKALPQTMDEVTKIRYFELVGLHREISEVPGLLAAVRDEPVQSGPARAASEALLRFESEEVWRQTREEFDRLRAAGKVSQGQYDFVVRELDRRIKDPASYSAQRRQQVTALAYEREKEGLERMKRLADRIRGRQPDQFVRDYEDYLARVAALAEKYRDSVYHDGLRSDVASGYAMLANFARFKLKRPSQALDYQVKSARAPPAAREGDYLSEFLAADLFQYDLADRGKAIEAYRRAADKLRAAKVDPGNWLARALAHEIGYLESGKTFSGSLGGEELGQFLGIVFVIAAGELGDPDLRFASLQPESVSVAQRSALEAQLERLGPSHLNFARAAPFLSLLSSEKSVLRFLRKHDPGGYWSASLALLVLHPEIVGERGAAVLFPGVRNDAAQATALAAVARAFIKQSGVSFQPPDGRRATPEKTWQLLLESLRAGDAATALACFSPGMRARLEPLFSKMTPAAMREMADSFTAFALQEGSGEMREAVLVRKVGDGQSAGFAYFVRHAGEWKIDQM